MSTPQWYSSLDAGAPQLIRNDPVSYLNILVACLVTGYGSKPAAGWSMLDARNDPTNPRIALKQGPGGASSPAPKYLRLGENAIQSMNGIYLSWFFTARGYETMSDVDTGNGDFPTTYQATSAQTLWPLSIAMNSNEYAYSSSLINCNSGVYSVNWCLVADDRFFYIIFDYWKTIEPWNFGGAIHGMFGDLVNTSVNDTGSCVLWSFNSSIVSGVPGTWYPDASYQYFFQPLYATNVSGTGYPGFRLCRSLNKATQGSVLAYTSFNSNLTSNTYTGSPGVPGVQLNPLQNTFIWQKYSVYENGGTYRGDLPGLINSVTNTGTSFGTTEWVSNQFLGSLNNVSVYHHYTQDPQDPQNTANFMNFFWRLDPWRT